LRFFEEFRAGSIVLYGPVSVQDAVGDPLEKAGGRRRKSMRFMLTFRVPMDEGNAGIKDGSLGQTLETIIDELKPEAAYFGPIEGARGGYLVVNFDDPSQLPAVAEPLLLGLGATIQISPVFTPDELPTETLQQAPQ
jgi:hypothetical protein